MPVCNNTSFDSSTEGIDKMPTCSQVFLAQIEHHSAVKSTSSNLLCPSSALKRQSYRNAVKSRICRANSASNVPSIFNSIDTIETSASSTLVDWIKWRRASRFLRQPTRPRQIVQRQKWTASAPIQHTGLFLRQEESIVKVASWMSPCKKKIKIEAWCQELADDPFKIPIWYGIDLLMIFPSLVMFFFYIYIRHLKNYE